MEDQEVAIIDWLQTFELPETASVRTLADLSDGYVISCILTQIAPSYFEANAVEQPVGEEDTFVATNNIKKIVRLLDGYYRYVLRKYIDTTAIDVDAIVTTKDADEILNLLELVVGAAVMCNDADMRSDFIQKIFSLDHSSQTFLKDLIQSVMSRAQDIEDDDMNGGGGLGSGMNNREAALEETALRAEEAAKHLREEQQRLLTIISELEQNNRTLMQEKQKLQHTVEDMQFEKLGSPSKGALESKSTALMNLQIELDELKRDLDLKNVEIDTLKSDLLSSRRQWEASAEMLQTLKMENSQMADELDVARDKAIKLAKAEASIEKYQLKLEEMKNLSKQNKELTAKLDQYLDQINHLESSNKGMVTLQRLVEQYKDKAVELEREKFEAVSAFQMKEMEVTSLKADISAITEARNILEDEVGTLRIELSQLQDDSSSKSFGATLSDDLDGTNDYQSVTALREKVKKLEYEIQSLRSSSNKEASAEGSTENVDTALLRAEIDDLKRSKKEREEQMLSLRKTIVETQNELLKANRSMQEAGTNSVAAVAAKDAELRLAQTNNTVRLLEERLKEHETTINKLEQEKSKLEIYARKTLTTFREKFMTSLETLKAEKKASDDRVVLLTEKLEANQETTRREERLILSSMYELGMKIMDRNLQVQMQSRSGQGVSFDGENGSINPTIRPAMTPRR